MDQDPARCARFYRRLGYNVLPRRADGKRPACYFRDYWERPVPADWFDRWTARSMQVMTGGHWGLLVIDLDGPEAEAVWAGWCRERGCPRTWTVRSGGGGLHLWFSVPKGTPVPSRFAWRVWDESAQDWAHHKAVEVLGDRKLAVAPPSVHPRTGQPYRFVAGRSPRNYARPSPAPAWVLDLPAVARPVRGPVLLPIAREKAPGVPVAGRFDRQAVLDAIADKCVLAASWGLRIVPGAPNPTGWVRCRAIGREDREPSAGFNVLTGVYHEPGEGRSLSLFDVAVELGVYADAVQAINHLGSVYLARPHAHAGASAPGRASRDGTPAREALRESTGSPDYDRPPNPGSATPGGLELGKPQSAGARASI